MSIPIKLASLILFVWAMNINAQNTTTTTTTTTTTNPVACSNQNNLLCDYYVKNFSNYCTLQTAYINGTLFAIYCAKSCNNCSILTTALTNSISSASSTSTSTSTTSTSTNTNLSTTTTGSSSSTTTTNTNPSTTTALNKGNCSNQNDFTCSYYVKLNPTYCTSFTASINGIPFFLYCANSCNNCNLLVTTVAIQTTSTSTSTTTTPGTTTINNQANCINQNDFMCSYYVQNYPTYCTSSTVFISAIPFSTYCARSCNLCGLLTAGK